MILNKQFILNLTYFGMTIEFLTAILSTIYLKYYKNIPTLKYLPYFLWYMFANELVSIIQKLVFDIYIDIGFNIYSLINYSYFLLLYRANVHNSNFKKIILVFVVGYLTLHIIDIFIEDYYEQEQTFPDVVASLFLMVAILFYFIQIINSKRVYNVYGDILFWIGLGSLLYYLGNTPFRIIRNYFQNWSQSYIMLLVNHFLAIIMYLCFIAGFILSKTKRNHEH